MTYLSLPQDALTLKPAALISQTYLKDIRKISKHIVATGLLNPLIVAQQQGRYIVVDGAKRLRAIRELIQNKRLPRTLNKIPCIIVDEASDMTGMAVKSDKPLLLTEADLVHGIILDVDAGLTNREICEKFACSDEVVNQALRVPCLHPKLQSAFSRGTIDLKQAAAFASFPNLKSQWQLLLALGPFASDTDIINAISGGNTVLELKTGDVIILPSRRPNQPAYTAAHTAKKQTQTASIAA